MAYTNEVVERRPVEVGRSSGSISLVRQVVEVLLEMGGSAHRDAVIDRIALRQGAARASERLTEEVVGAFERHRAGARRRNEPPLVYLPFGEGSRRWGVVVRPLAPPVAHAVTIDRPIERSPDNDDAAMAVCSAMGQVPPPALHVALLEAMSGDP